jgi:hypothetical protein
MVGGSNTRRNLARVLAITLAFVFAVFLSQVASHSHQNRGNEAACHVCQAAHLGPAPQAGALTIETPLVSAGYVQPFLLSFHEELFFHDSPSRAPPSV